MAKPDTGIMGANRICLIVWWNKSRSGNHDSHQDDVLHDTQFSEWLNVLQLDYIFAKQNGQHNQPDRVQFKHNSTKEEYL